MAIEFGSFYHHFIVPKQLTQLAEIYRHIEDVLQGLQWMIVRTITNLLKLGSFNFNWLLPPSSSLASQMLTFSRKEVQLKTIKIFLNHIFILLNSISSLVFSSISTDFSFFFLTGLSNVDLFKKRSVTRNWNSLFCAQSSTITEGAATLKLSRKILFAPNLKPGHF